MNIEISVIIPVYNTKNYLEKCINSILLQDFINIEIIIIDDGSTDGSSELCDKYATIDHRIRVIHQQNKGLSEARNIGIQIANGYYLSFIDSDDYIEPNMLSTLYNNLLQYDADISMCQMQYEKFDELIIPEKHKHNKIYLSKDYIMESYLLPKGLDRRINAGIPNKLYKKSLFENITFPVGKCFEDFFVTHLLLHFSKGLIIDLNHKYHYVQRENSISHTTNTLMDLIEGLSNLYDFIEKEYPHQKKEYRQKIISMLIPLALSLLENKWENTVDKILTLIKNKFSEFNYQNCGFTKKEVDECELIIKEISKYHHLTMISQFKANNNV